MNPIKPYLHVMTLFDSANGDPYGQLCDCPLPGDHDKNGLPADLEEAIFERLLDGSTLGSPAARHIQSLAPWSKP